MRRHLEPEMMDDPALDVQQHIQALRGLARINRLSGSVRIVWPPILRLARQIGTRSLRVLDIATGAGDVPIGLWTKAQRAGLHLEADGCDRSRTAVEYARQHALQAGADIRFSELNALTSEIPSGYDVVMNSLFLHHLALGEAEHLLRKMARAAKRMVLVNDLVRSTAGLGLAYVGTRLLSTSVVVHRDGPQSVRAAYTIDEVRALAQRAGLERAKISTRWPCRFLLEANPTASG